jgi:hypothetical protein
MMLREELRRRLLAAFTARKRPNAFSRLLPFGGFDCRIGIWRPSTTVSQKSTTLNL